MIQFSIFINHDVKIYLDKLHRVETSRSLNFFEEFTQEVLPFLPEENTYKIYKDMRLYLPDSDLWNSFSKFETLDYGYFIEQDPHLILLSQQRIYDYTSESALENAINPEQMQLSYEFYMDANNEELEGYTLIFRNEYGLTYIKDALYINFFSDN